MTAPDGTIDLLGTRYAPLDPQAALDRVAELYEREDPAFVVYANVHTLNLAAADPSYQQVLGRADLVLNDGKGVMLGARLAGARFPADLNGNYFTPLLLRLAARRGWPVYLLGAEPGVAREAARRLEEEVAGLRVVGVRDGFFSPAQEHEVIESIRSAGTGLLLVALGNPRQETWIDANLASTGARVALGVGAFFDFETGHVKRAPRWMQRVGMEWVHRLLTEPRRMWRRYVIGNPLFLARVIRARLSRRRRTI